MIQKYIKRYVSMQMMKATIEHADCIGQIHFLAWKQAYEEIFPEEYLQK